MKVTNLQFVKELKRVEIHYTYWTHCDNLQQLLKFMIDNPNVEVILDENSSPDNKPDDLIPSDPKDYEFHLKTFHDLVLKERPNVVIHRSNYMPKPKH